MKVLPTSSCSSPLAISSSSSIGGVKDASAIVSRVIYSASNLTMNDGGVECCRSKIRSR